MLGKHNFHLSRRTVEFGYLSPLDIYSVIKQILVRTHSMPGLMLRTVVM